MAKDESGQPPYFNIDPERALSELDAPTTTAGFAGIAQACLRGPLRLRQRLRDGATRRI